MITDLTQPISGLRCQAYALALLCYVNSSKAKVSRCPAGVLHKTKLAEHASRAFTELMELRY